MDQASVNRCLLFALCESFARVRAALCGMLEVCMRQRAFYKNGLVARFRASDPDERLFMSHTISLSFGSSNPRVRNDAFAVRRAVFMEEQGYENEFGAIDDDASCIHVVLYVDGELAGCARAFPEELEHTLEPGAPQSPTCALDEGVQPGQTYLLGRVAVLPAMRRRGLARELITACERAARGAGAKLLALHAQEYIYNLYAAAGYEQISDVDYEDEGRPHLWMAKRL